MIVVTTEEVAGREIVQTIGLVRGNTIRDTRAPMKRTGIRIGKNCQRIEVADNRIAGLANNVLDLRASAS